MTNLSVGDIVLFKSSFCQKDLLCLIINVENIYNIPTENRFLQYHLFSPESTHKFIVWNNSCKSSSSLERIN